MKDEISIILDNYAYRGVNHKILVEAANDPLLPTAELIEKALVNAKFERSGIEVKNFALLVLQQRADKEVLQTALSLLKTSNPAERLLGCRLLRELPSLDEAPYPHSQQAVKALKQMIANEKDEEVLIWALAAVGWQCHPDGMNLLIQLKDDKRPEVRRVVANNLLKVYRESAELPDVIAKAFLDFAKDPDEDIRWSAFYDIAEFPEIFEHHKESLKAASINALKDPDARVQEQAHRALTALEWLKRD